MGKHLLHSPTVFASILLINLLGPQTILADDGTQAPPGEDFEEAYPCDAVPADCHDDLDCPDLLARPSVLSVVTHRGDRTVQGAVHHRTVG